MPEEDGGADTITQDLYPYAGGGRPVAYTPPGQPYFDGQRTVGGWYRADTDLRAMLVDEGLPPTPPGSNGSGSDVPWPALTGLGLFALGLAAATWLVLRRRPHTAATP